MPADEVPYLSSASQVAELALEADVAVTLLTHLWPGSSTERVLAATRPHEEVLASGTNR